MQQSYPPTMDNVEETINFHLEKDKSLAPVFAVYKSILTVQLDYLGKIEVNLTLATEKIKDCFRQGKHLLAEQKPVLDSLLFKEVLASIIKAIQAASPDAPEELTNLAELAEFETKNIDSFLQQVICLNKEEMEAFIEEKEMDKRAALDSEVIAFVIFMSLSPFVVRIMQAVETVAGFSLWRQGYCPVCGQTAQIAKHRNEDGARLLECWFCHAQWVFPRVECPYCDNKEQKKLRFFYVPGNKGYQVHVCEVCKSYLKTVDAKSLQKDVILEIESIATGQLDLLAEQEGYKPPGSRAPLLH